jgi:hypothetical protein
MRHIKYQNRRGHTPALHIDAEVPSIKFAWTRSSKVGQTKLEFVRTFKGPVFYVPDLQHADGHYWHLELTAQAQEGGELLDALCNEHMQCVVLENQFALVVWREERIGVLALETYLDEDLNWLHNESIGTIYSSPGKNVPQTRNLRDVVQSERRAVVVR